MDSARPRKRVLDPVERMSEILFGLIMVLSFTCSLSVASAGREEVRTMLYAAIGGNTAWGIVDAIVYIVNSLIDRGRELRLEQAIRDAKDSETVRRLVDGAIPATVAVSLDANIYEAIRQRAIAASPPTQSQLTRDDVESAVAVFLLVFFSTFPVVLPFVFIDDARVALRASNGVALVLLFALGYRLARYTTLSPIRLGLAAVGLGVVLVAITVAFGG